MSRSSLRRLGRQALALLLPLTVSLVLAEDRARSREIDDSVVWAERLVESQENNATKEQIRERRLALEAAYERVIRLGPSYHTWNPTHFGPVKVHRLLGMLAIYEGQFAEAERRFAEAITLAERSEQEREDLSDLARARATALALDGRFHESTVLLAETPCATGASCSISLYSKTCRQVMAKTITIDWSLVKRGPRGLCPATAFIQSAEIAEALSRSDLVEPFARLAVFAATDLRFVAAGEAGAVRFDATLLLFNWFRLRNRDAEAAALIRAARTDTELAAAGGEFFRSLEAWTRDIESSPATAAALPSANPYSSDTLDEAIASNERALDEVTPNLITVTPWIGGPQANTGSMKNASEILRALAMQYRLKRDFVRARQYSDQALYYVPGFVAPSLPLRLDFGPRGPTCPPGRMHLAECKAWNEDSIDSYANAFVSELLHERALIEADAGNVSEALLIDERGTRVLQNWLARNWPTQQDVLQTLKQRRWLESERLGIFARIAQGSGPEADAAKARAFEAVQLLQFNRVEAGLRSAIARGASGTAEHQLILQQRQVLQEERFRVRNDRAASEAVAGRIDFLERPLPFSASEFERRTTFAALDLDSARAALTPDEALVVLTQLDDRIEAMAITTAGVTWVTAPASEAWVQAEVEKLRRHLDNPRGDPQGFDRNAAYMLYQRILAPLTGQFGNRLLFISANGPLAEVPLQILVTERPRGSDVAPQALRDTAWLMRNHALVSLPSVASLRSLKANKRVNRRDALIGIGAPPGASPLPEEEVRTDEDRQLKFAAAELKKLGESRRGGPVVLLTGPNATEARLRATDLRSTAILAFATHAKPGGAPESPYPGLVLARDPRNLAGATNDGFLSADEVALLPIGADIVILSACSTTSSDGRGGEVLSGLALSFLFAGGQTVIATHWPVVDAAAAELVTGAIGGAASPSPQELARRLQIQMQQLMMSSSDSRFADPRVWGAFVVVGG